jgi:hypothetical protein
MPLFSLTPFSTGGSWQGMRCIICSWVRLAGEAWRDVDQDFIIYFLGQFKKEYPEAKVIGVEALVEKKRAEGLILDGGKLLSPSFFFLSRNVFAHGRQPMGRIPRIPNMVLKMRYELSSSNCYSASLTCWVSDLRLVRISR